MQLKYAELHAPLFLGRTKLGQGINLGMKLDPVNRVGLDLEFDEEKQLLYVSYNETKAIVPLSNVVCMIHGKPDEKPAPNQHVTHWQAPVDGKVDETLERAKVVTAQVDSPQSHVFAGPGKGKTGKDK